MKKTWPVRSMAEMLTLAAMRVHEASWPMIAKRQDEMRKDHSRWETT